MKRRLFVRSVSWILVIVLLAQIAPLQTLAAMRPAERSDSEDILASAGSIASPEIQCELGELRKEDSKQFLMDDGSYLAVSYGMPVHYQDAEGEWIDIDNTLTSAYTYSASAYSVANGEAATAFARNLTEGLLFSTEYKGNRASLSLLDAAEAVELLREMEQKDAGLVPGQGEIADIQETTPVNHETAPTESDRQETELPEDTNNPEDTVSAENNNDSAEKSQAEVGTDAEKSHIDEEQADPTLVESSDNIQAVQPEISNTAEETLDSEELEENSSATQAPEETPGTMETEPLATVDPSMEGLAYDRTAKAQIIKPEELAFTLTEEQAPLADQIIPEKLSSAILYSDVYPDVDLEYNITGYNIKESIIVKKPLDSYSFSFRMDLDGLTPILQEDGSISLTDENGLSVYLIPAPYMFDADYHPSNAASYTVTALEDGYLLTVEADAQWMNAPERAYPVTIDPTFIKTAGNADGEISSTYVVQGAPKTAHNSHQNLYFGYSSFVDSDGNMQKEHQIYMHFDSLPKLPASSVVVNASLNLWQFNYSHVGCPKMDIGLYEVIESKPSDCDTYRDWMHKMLWPDRPDYDSANMIDYTTASAAEDDRYLSWEITELVNKWYQNGTENRTIALIALDAASYNTSYCAAPAFYAYGQTHPPILTVSYRNNTGIEPYYTYQTMSAGNAGTAYISDFSRQLTVAKDLFSFSSTVHPFTAQLIFNSSYIAKQTKETVNPYDLGEELGLEMHFGSGCTYNFIQSVKRETIDGVPYIRYIDGDGTIHYFAQDAKKSAEINKETGENKTYYFDEDGLGLKINEYHTNYYSLTDDKGNELVFVEGFLLWINGSDGSRITLHYSRNGASVIEDYPSASGSRLEYITQRTDGGTSATIATFTYKSHMSVNNYLDTITDYAGNRYSFDYQDGSLVGIRYNGRQIAAYTMTQSGGKLKSELVKMTDVESGYSLKFSYQNHKISAVEELAGGGSGRKLEVSQTSDSRTVYRDAGNDGTLRTADDILTSYGFDYAGRTVNAYTTDNAGKILGASNAAYSNNTGTDKKNNRTLRTATIGIAGQQEMRNSGFESTSSDVAWKLSGGGTAETTAAITTAKPHSGLKSFQGWLAPGKTATIGAYKATNQLAAGATYTLSAYVNTAEITSFSSSGIYLQVSDGSGNIWNSNPITYATSANVENGWTRLTVTFTTKLHAEHTIAVYNSGCAGTFYADDFQLEAGSSPSARNMVENGSLQYWGYGWNLGAGASYVTKNGLNSTDNYAYSIQIVGLPKEQHGNAWQDIPINLPSSQTYVLSGWAKANAVPDNVQTAPSPDWDQNKQYGLRAIVFYTDGVDEYHYVPFNPDLPGWQFTSMTIVPRKANKTVSKIKVLCAYERNANKAYFDNISLVQEAAQTMRYDSDGNLVSVSTAGLKEDTDTYQNGNLIKSVTGGNGTFTYTYDKTKKHRLTSVTNGVVTQSMAYDGAGNVTSTTLKSNSAGQTKTLTSKATYGGRGNLLTSVTDAAGQTISYTYGNAQSVMWGQPTAVKDAKGNTTQTAYDDQGRATQKTFANGGALSYNYEKGLPETITRTTSDGESQSVSCGYDGFGNLTDVSVGGLLLASYQYGAGNGPLEKQTYGSGEEISFAYDNLGRVQKTTYSGGRELTYAYTGDGYLYSVLDNAGTSFTYDDTAYFYTYDSLGRTIACQVRRGMDVILEAHWEYDDCSRVKSQAWQMGGESYKETFTYSATDGSLSKIQRANGGEDISLSYDGLERLISASNGLYSRTYTYRDISATQTTSQVQSVQYTGLGGDLSGLSYAYTYDALGNIETMTPSAGNEETYTYDSMGQLTGAVIGETSYGYTYDGAGNLLTAQAGEETNVYTYGNENWKDLLTAYNGQPIMYEGQTMTDGVVSGTPVSGNPIRYNNRTQFGFSWSEGRNLSTATTSSNTYTFRYDADGLRTQKNSANSGVSRVSNYLYAGGKLLRETRGVAYSHGPSSSSTLDFTYDASGSPYSLIYNNGRTTATYYYITNLQGDVMYLVDENGNEAAAYTYDPYGKILTATGTMAGINPLRYRGYYYDTETGFYYLQSRYYDPTIGRFINADSYASTGQGLLGHNMFAYCNNNPINRVDPAGHVASEIWNFFETMFIEIGNTITSWAPQYSKCGEIALADGGLPIGDAIGLVGATFLTFGAVGLGIYRAATAPPKTISKARTQEKSVAIPDQSKKQAYFPINPYDFNPKGLVMTEYPGTINGRIIVWRDPVTQAKIFEWDEDLKYGSHYHAMMIEWDGKHEGPHLLPGTPVPEPWNSIYFGG